MTNPVEMMAGRGIDALAIPDGIPSLIIVVSSDSRVVYMNDYTERILTGGNANHVNVCTMFHQKDRPVLMDGLSRCAMERKMVMLADVSLESGAGNMIFGLTIAPLADQNGLTAGYLLYGTDVTNKKNLERQLLQASKMATIGEMATGVAHEMNQPLNIMKISAQRLEEAVVDGIATQEFTLERISVILKQIDRLAGIVTHLRIFGRSDLEEFRPLDMNDPIRNALAFLQEQLKGRSIEVSLHLAPDLPKVRGNATRLEQVFMNLMVNSRDMFEEKPGKSIAPAISMASRHEHPGNFVRIDYFDNGTGIPAANLDRVFDPFFTTKETGKGTGLGLSISAGIIGEHGGVMLAEPCDSGVHFTVIVPAIREEE